MDRAALACSFSGNSGSENPLFPRAASVFLMNRTAAPVLPGLIRAWILQQKNDNY